MRSGGFWPWLRGVPVRQLQPADPGTERMHRDRRGDPGRRHGLPAAGSTGPCDVRRRPRRRHRAGGQSDASPSTMQPRRPSPSSAAPWRRRLAGFIGMRAATRANVRTANGRAGAACRRPFRGLLRRLRHGHGGGGPGPPRASASSYCCSPARDRQQLQHRQRLRPGRQLHRALRPGGRRHLHQGGRRGRRPGGQGGGRHPRGRPPQPRGDRRQRGRQRGRRGRHGRRPLRVLRRLHRRRDGRGRSASPGDGRRRVPGVRRCLWRSSAWASSPASSAPSSCGGPAGSNPGRGAAQRHLRRRRPDARSGTYVLLPAAPARRAGSACSTASPRAWWSASSSASSPSTTRPADSPPVQGIAESSPDRHRDQHHRRPRRRDASARRSPIIVHRRSGSVSAYAVGGPLRDRDAGRGHARHRPG